MHTSSKVALHSQACTFPGVLMHRELIVTHLHRGVVSPDASTKPRIALRFTLEIVVGYRILAYLARARSWCWDLYSLLVSLSGTQWVLQGINHLSMFHRYCTIANYGR
jgi:hypothetical protein